MGLLSRLRAFMQSLRPAYPWPALDLTLPGGQHLHLVGSIHMGTRDMAPLSGRLLEKLRQADALVVEADIRHASSPLEEEVQQARPLHERLDAKRMAQLEKLAQEMALPLSGLDNRPAWQVALLLQAHQAQRLGLRPDYGIDYQLLQAASTFQLPVMELEGAGSQMALLKSLPRQGLALLEDTLIYWHTNARLLQTMISWWLEQPPQPGRVQLPGTFSNELYELLMHQRNQQWRDYLYNLPPGNYVVAVGALHLYGEGNLPDCLILG